MIKGFTRGLYIYLFIQLFLFHANGEEIPQSLLLKYRLVSEITIVGNYKTKRDIVVSELLMKEGNYVEVSKLPDLIKRSEENLQNTSLFNMVKITYFFPTIKSVEINIEVEERWYLWAFPLFEAAGRNFADFLRTNNGSDFNYGIYLKHDNLRGRRDQLKLRFVTGYSTQAIVEYINPAKNQNSGWGAKTVWYVYDKVAYTTENDQQVFIKTPGDRLLREMSFHWSYFYRYRLDNHHNITLSYFDIVAADTLVNLKPEYFYEDRAEARTLDVLYNYRLDRRDSKIYPLNGFNLDLSFSRRGLSLVSDYSGFTALEVASSYQSPLINRFFGRSNFKGLLTDQSRVPYFYKSGLGYREYLNGFEYKVIDGTSHAALKNKLMYELSPRRDILLNWMPIKQFSRIHYAFYLSANIDIGYVYNKYPSVLNHMANSLLVGYGVGIDLVTFYDQIWSFNYSFNNFGEHGLYFHLNLVL